MPVRFKFDTEALKQAVPITEIISRYTDITPDTKGNIRCPAPSHDDKTPSAKIYTQSNRVRCFGQCCKSFDIIALTEEYFPELSFRDVCRKLIDEFNLDIYRYSNLAEVEAERSAKFRNVFHDHFPIDDKEIEALGLYNPKHGKVEELFNIKAEDYYLAVCGEIPPNAQIKDKNGDDLIIKLSHGDAVFYDLIPCKETDANGKPAEHTYTKVDTLQDMWKEDKRAVEQFLIDKGNDLLDEIDMAIADFEDGMKEWNSETAIYRKNAKTFYDMKQNDPNVNLIDTQYKMAAEYVVMHSYEQELSALRAERLAVAKIVHKITQHGQAREKHENQKNNNYRDY